MLDRIRTIFPPVTGPRIYADQLAALTAGFQDNIYDVAEAVRD
jgi:hypothetical protein